MTTDAGDYDCAEMISGIQRWLWLESPSTSADALNRMLDLIESETVGTDLLIERVHATDGAADQLVVRYRPAHASGEPILILSHIDTVHEIGTAAGGNPVRVDGDRLFGPGVSDMKGGAYIALQALIRVARARASRRPISFIFTTDEEIGSPRSRPLIEREAKNAAFALVTEAGRPGGEVVTSRCGVGRYIVGAHGRAAHAGRWDDGGANAIIEAARIALAIEAQNDRAKGVKLTVTLCSGGVAENVVPDFAELTVDTRFSTDEGCRETDRFLKALRPSAEGFRVQTSGGVNRPVFSRSEETGQLFSLAQGLARQIGFDLEEAPMAGGGSDANFTAALGVPTLDGLGIVGGGGHTMSEYGLVSSIVGRARLMEALLKSL